MSIYENTLETTTGPLPLIIGTWAKKYREENTDSRSAEETIPIGRALGSGTNGEKCKLFTNAAGQNYLGTSRLNQQASDYENGNYNENDPTLYAISGYLVSDLYEDVEKDDPVRILINNDPDQGFQEIENTEGSFVGTTVPGVASADARLQIDIDGAGNETLAIAWLITDDWDTIIAKFQTEITGQDIPAIIDIVDGRIRVTSDAEGSTSTVVITEGATNGFLAQVDAIGGYTTAIRTAQDGIDSPGEIGQYGTTQKRDKTVQINAFWDDDGTVGNGASFLLDPPITVTADIWEY